MWLQHWLVQLAGEIQWTQVFKILLSGWFLVLLRGHVVSLLCVPMRVITLLRKKERYFIFQVLWGLHFGNSRPWAPSKRTTFRLSALSKIQTPYILVTSEAKIPFDEGFAGTRLRLSREGVLCALLSHLCHVNLLFFERCKTLLKLLQREHFSLQGQQTTTNKPLPTNHCQQTTTKKPLPTNQKLHRSHCPKEMCKARSAETCERERARTTCRSWRTWPVQRWGVSGDALISVSSIRAHTWMTNPRKTRTQSHWCLLSILSLPPFYPLPSLPVCLPPCWHWLSPTSSSIASVQDRTMRAS